MSDIGLTYDTLTGAADVVIGAADLQTDAGLEAAVMLSLNTDRRAEAGDELPDGQTDRRGWWADGLGEPADDRWGSRLWLLDRSKRTPDVLTRAETYAREALQWLIDDLVATAVDVTAEFIGTGSAWALAVTIHRPQKDPASYRYDRAWAAQEQRL